MKINKGFKIDSPNIFVPWEISEKELVVLFKGTEFKSVTNGYYTISCESLGGLKCFIGFCFEQRDNGVLNELEFFRDDYSNEKKSFSDFQTHFEKKFGKPTEMTEGVEGYNNYQWSIDGIRIVHFIYDRFGLEEHMRIKFEGKRKVKNNSVESTNIKTRSNFFFG